MKLLSIFRKGKKEPLPNIDWSVSESSKFDPQVLFTEERFLSWRNEGTGYTQTHKIDMRACTALTYYYDNLCVVVDGERYCPPLSFDRLDHIWATAQQRNWVPGLVQAFPVQDE
jgi:hypothetical protein